MKKYLFLILSITLFYSCTPESESRLNPELTNDIVKYINDNNLNAIKTDSGLYYVILKEGTGDTPDPDSSVRTKLKGSYLNGNVFSEDGPNGTAVDLALQIPGIVEGLQLFKEGGEGILLIPSELAFNDGFAIVVDVNLIDVIDNEADILAYINNNNLNAQKTDSGLYYIINNEGSGASATSNSNVTVAYKGYLLDGTVFDESNIQGTSFNLNQVIPGWQEGIPLFKEGGEGTLLIPYQLGYGLQGRDPIIPGGTVIAFDINLISIND